MLFSVEYVLFNGEGSGIPFLFCLIITQYNDAYLTILLFHIVLCCLLSIAESMRILWHKSITFLNRNLLTKVSHRFEQYLSISSSNIIIKSCNTK